MPPRSQLFISKADKNQPAIVSAFRSLGFQVKHTHTIKGFCDIVISKDNINHLIEIKSEKGKLTPDEKQFHLVWKTPVHIIRNINQVLLFSEWHDTLIKKLGVPGALLDTPTS